VAAIETGTQDLLARVEDGVAVLTMNRPERRNALSAAMLEALAAALENAETNPEIACVVLTGAGGAFCAGGDVKAMAESNDASMDYDARVAVQRRNQRATSGRLHTMPKPTIAALPGAAAGAGLALALACDLRIAARSAVLTTAFARVGLAGDYGGTWFLTRLVGSARARELYFLSERLAAEDAERLGLVNRVVDDERLEAEALALASRLAAGPRVCLAYMKENLNRAESGDELGECMDLEATHHLRTAMTEDHREAAAAFAEKREPTFRGR
jgi:2-(1,2-epoxy-1,2-dihydrophenyl)acetyl-CoA isomerase